MADLIPPTPEEVRARRLAAGWTMAEAAEKLHTSTRAYQQWEAPDLVDGVRNRGARRIHLAVWHLFLLLSERTVQKRTLADRAELAIG